MKALPAVLVVAVMILGSIPLWSEVDASTTIDAYTRKMVTLNNFELYSISDYGEWSLAYNPTFVAGPHGWVNGQPVQDISAASLTNHYSTDRTQGNYSYVRELAWTNASHVIQGYDFTLDDYYGGLRFYDVQFDYKIVVSIDDTSELTYGVAIEDGDSSGWRHVGLIMDGAWHTSSVSPYLNDSTPTWFSFYVSVYQTYDTSHPVHCCNGTISVYLDNIVAYAPACDVRFSFYNAYTGIGLDSSELVIQVWYDGVWTRIWDNEYTIAAGEHIGYKVTDYFGQVVAFVPDVRLDHTTVYIDIPVKLVKVHITKPQWYDSSIPPTWYLTFTATGTEIPVEGWDLELIAGLYSFRWDTTTVSAGNDSLDPSDDLVVEEGSISQFIDGNLSSGQSFTVCDFYLSMQPTYSATSNATATILPSLYSWDGLAKFANELVDEIYSNTWYKSIMLTIGIAGVITWAGAAWTKGKKAAAKAAKEKEEGKR